MNVGNITKASFQADIKRKQSFFNRCKRRFKVANTPAERQFLRSEASRICSELKQCTKKWKTCGFGAFLWITRSFSVTKFTAGRTSSSRRVSGRKTSARSTSTRRCVSRSPKTRSSTRGRSSASRRSYVAW